MANISATIVATDRPVPVDNNARATAGPSDTPDATAPSDPSAGRPARAPASRSDTGVGTDGAAGSGAVGVVSACRHQRSERRLGENGSVSGVGGRRGLAVATIAAKSGRETGAAAAASGAGPLTAAAGASTGADEEPTLVPVTSGADTFRKPASAGRSRPGRRVLPGLPDPAGGVVSMTSPPHICGVRR